MNNFDAMDGHDVYEGQTRTLAHALKPRPQQTYIVGGILPRRSLSLWFGSPGSLKSNLLLDMGLAVATGSRWLPDLPSGGNGAGLAVTQCPTLAIDVDNGEDILSERLAAFASAYSAPPDAPLYWLTFPVPPIVASKSLKYLTNHALSLGVGLIMIDNLLRVTGVRDENASEIDTAMSNLRKLAEDTGAAVCVIHHRRKDTNGREGDSIRGHSSIEAALDAAFLVKRSGDTVTVTCTKARRKPIETFSALWTYDHQADGETLREARFYRVPVCDMKAQAEAELQARILDTVADKPLTKSAIRTATGGRRDIVYAVIDKMRLEGVLKPIHGDRNATFYAPNG